MKQLFNRLHNHLHRLFKRHLRGIDREQYHLKQILKLLKARQRSLEQQLKQPPQPLTTRQRDQLYAELKVIRLQRRKGIQRLLILRQRS